ncbi:transcription antitermination protein NusG [Candidatus Magnetoovum chiemensis]|nr:transcription antitermination protein NusG [Candidatus Magnetoovum chiemensis]
MSFNINYSSGGLCWYAVHVRSRHEFKVSERLEMLKLEAFLPVIERVSTWKDRRKRVMFPLFPSYLFVRIKNTSNDKLSVLQTPGVITILRKTGAKSEYDAVPDEQITSLRKLIQTKTVLDPYFYLEDGDRIRITKGPLAGIEGLLVRKEKKHLLVLLVDILRQGVSVVINASDTEKV